MTKVRRNLKLNEVSICKNPANPEAHVALFKSQDVIEDEQMPFDVSKLDEDGQKAFADLEKARDGFEADAKKATTEKDDAVAKAESTSEELEKLQPKKDPEEVNKDDLDPKVQAYLEKSDAKSEELAKDNDDLKKRMAKMEDDKETDRLTKFLTDEVPFAVAKDDREDEIKTLKSLDEDGQKRYMASLVRNHKALENADIFKEAGRGGSGSTTAGDAIAVATAEMRKLHPDMTEAEAMTKALNVNPELYADHKSERANH